MSGSHPSCSRRSGIGDVCSRENILPKSARAEGRGLSWSWALIGTAAALGTINSFLPGQEWRVLHKHPQFFC